MSASCSPATQFVPVGSISFGSLIPFMLHDTTQAASLFHFYDASRYLMLDVLLPPATASDIQARSRPHPRWQGFMFSVAPIVVRSPSLQKMVQRLPLESLVLETDCPALVSPSSPRLFRGWASTVG
jgi:hypothetical protein